MKLNKKQIYMEMIINLIEQNYFKNKKAFEEFMDYVEKAPIHFSIYNFFPYKWGVEGR